MPNKQDLVRVKSANLAVFLIHPHHFSCAIRQNLSPVFQSSIFQPFMYCKSETNRFVACVHEFLKLILTLFCRLFAQKRECLPFAREGCTSPRRISRWQWRRWWRRIQRRTCPCGNSGSEKLTFCPIVNAYMPKQLKAWSEWPCIVGLAVVRFWKCLSNLSMSCNSFTSWSFAYLSIKEERPSGDGNQFFTCLWCCALIVSLSSTVLPSSELGFVQMISRI